MTSPTLRIRGAHLHNLHDIDLDLPLTGLTALVGPSGSGKSSLALGTIHAAARARLALALGLQDDSPPVPVDQLDGLPLTIAVGERRQLSGTARVLDLLGLSSEVGMLALAAGHSCCPVCGRTLTVQSADQIAATILGLPHVGRVTILAPLRRASSAGAPAAGAPAAGAPAAGAPAPASSLSAVLAEVGQQGFARVAVDGVIHRLDDLPVLDARIGHDVDVVIDRLRLGADRLTDDRQARLEEAIATALTAGRGRVLVHCHVDNGSGDRIAEAASATHQPQVLSYGERPWCPDHEGELDAVQASWLAGRAGARCRVCEGRGFTELSATPALPSSTPAGSTAARRCESCEGSGLRAELRHFELPADHGVPPLRWVKLLTQPLEAGLGRLLSTAALVAAPGARHQVRRVRSEALALGLGHLPLARTVAELAAGELRRLLLLHGILTAASVSGSLLILDEPTAGLDAESAERVVSRIVLAAQHNAVLAVDHRRSLVDGAEHAVAFGPGAGHRGGRICWQGPGSGLPQDLLPSPQLIAPRETQSASSALALLLAGAAGRSLSRGHSLGVDLVLPRSGMTVVTGPSGSGKSTLLIDTLIPAVRHSLGLVSPAPLPFDSLSGTDGIERLLTFERSPLGRNKASCVATAIGIWSHLRTLLAASRDARMLGYPAARFRLDRAGGRCESCQGTGIYQVDVHSQSGLASFQLDEPCPSCGGARFQQDTLRVRLKGRSVRELLACDLDVASQLFANHRRLGPPLAAACRVGLGYLPLGQASSTLSGGESQRLRLARAVAGTGGIGAAAQRRLDDCLLVVDGPTVGLHPGDVTRVIDALRQLTDRGATAAIASVEPQLLAAADHVLQLPG